MIRIFITAVLFTLLAVIALAQGPLPEVDATKATEALVLGISTVSWVLICSGAGLLIIMLLRYLLLPRLKGKPLAIASCVLIGIAASATTLILSPDKWMEAIMVGVAAGMSAGNAWNLIPDGWTKAFNKFIKTKADKKAAKKRANGG